MRFESVHEFDFADWNQAATSTFGALTIKAPNEQRFHARMRVIQSGEVALYEMWTPPHHVLRRSVDVPADETDYYKLNLQLSGTSRVVQDGRECFLNPGDLALFATHRPYELEYTSAQQTLLIHFPSSMLTLPAKQVDRLTARPVSREVGLGRVALPMFDELVRNLELLDGPNNGPFLRSALNMLIAVLVSEEPPERALADQVYIEALEYIEKHYAEEDLSPPTIAKALFVSVRHLHACFAGQGTTVGGQIRRVRLQRLRDDLANPRLANVSIGAIGARHGLFDASHISRLFRAEFDESPRAFRTRALALAAR